MSTPHKPLSIQGQIAQAMQAISASDERLRTLRVALASSARRTMLSRRTLWLAGTAGLLLAGVVLYPRRRAALRYVRAALHHPVGRMLMPHIPGMNGLLSGLALMSSLRARKHVGSALVTLVSTALPWLLRHVKGAAQDTRHPSS